jgi:O-antigen/teichoic acid export membrane protein
MGKKPRPKARAKYDGAAAGWLRGAAFLGIAAILSKLLGTLQKIPLQNIAGDEAFGIYNAVYPLYILILFLATAGFPITVSKFVAERVSIGDQLGALRIVRVSSVILVGTGIFFFAGLYAGAPQIAEWVGTAKTVPAIRSVSFALLLAPLMAVLRGYFQGYQNMVPTAVSQVVEQLVRVVTMLALLLYLSAMEAPMELIAAGATFGSVTGTLGGLFVMLRYWWKDRAARAALTSGSQVLVTGGGDASRTVGQEIGQGKAQENSKKDKSVKADSAVDFQKISTLRLLKRITVYAIPICLGTIGMPLLTLVDTFTLPRLLEAAHGSEAEAMRQFGLYNRGLPLVQLVAMIATSVSAVLVPMIAVAHMKGNHHILRSQTEMAIRYAWLVGLAASFGLAFLAAPVNVMLYRTDEASWTLAILAFTALFSTLNTVTSSVLQGLGAVRTPALTLLIAVVLKALGNVWLLPRWGLEGAALSAVIAFAAAAGLNLVQVVRCTGVRFALRRYAVTPTLAVGVMGVCLAALQLGAKAVPAWLWLPERWSFSVIALIGVGGGAAVYIAALLRSGAISREELRLMPALDRRLTPVLEKLRLLPKG